MKKLLVTLTVLTLVLTSSALAFDGNRKGFVLGGGLGFAPNSSLKVEGASSDLSGAGLGVNLLLGYGWDERNLIVYEGNITAWNVDILIFSRTVNQGFNGASWYHYYGTAGSSAFTTLGAGFYILDVEGAASVDPGFGILLGAGYEFARHWQVGAYFSAGKASDVSTDFELNHFSILLNGVAF